MSGHFLTFLCCVGIAVVIVTADENFGYNYQEESGDFGQPSPSFSPQPQEFIKEFYTYSAPEHEFGSGNLQSLIGAVRHNIRVVFIKAPENKGIEQAALALAQQAAEQKTAIFVLNRQPDIGYLAEKINALRSLNQHKPEVHFVKYRTPDDARNAQEVIQAEYNTLGGVSQSFSGNAPVHDFASQAPIRAPVIESPNTGYLPAELYRRLRYRK